MDLAELRRAKDEHFGKAHDSPLTVTQRQHFDGLRYFDPDPAFRFEVALDGPPGGVEEVEMSDGTDAALLAFHQGDALFIPFRDTTSGKETYGAGRYVEAEALCAYNDDWRCPLPPAENWLKVAIRAGEKSFH